MRPTPDITGALYWAASELNLPTLADSGYDGTGQGIHTSYKQPGDGRHLAVDNRAHNLRLRPPDLDRAIATAVGRGYDPGAPRVMSRRSSYGTLLMWRLTAFAADPADGLVPFLIDWRTTAHPTTAALPTVPLHSLEAEHPNPGRIRMRLAALDVDLPVRSGRRPRLVMTLQGPDGLIMLS